MKPVVTGCSNESEKKKILSDSRSALAQRNDYGCLNVRPEELAKIFETLADAGFNREQLLPDLKTITTALIDGLARVDPQDIQLMFHPELTPEQLVRTVKSLEKIGFKIDELKLSKNDNTLKQIILEVVLNKAGVDATLKQEMQTTVEKMGETLVTANSDDGYNSDDTVRIHNSNSSNTPTSRPESPNIPQHSFSHLV